MHASPSPDADIPWELELDPEAVRRRFAWARERGHPRYLWPEVEPGEWRAALRELERVAREVLAGGRTELVGDARALGVAGFTSGLGPLLGRWLEDGDVSAGGPAGRLFALHLAHGRARAERLDAHLDDVCAALDGAGVAPLVVKSAHTARTYFPEPGARPSVDLDVVVGPAAFGAAEEVLAARGWVRSAGQERPRKSDWLAPGAAALPRSLEMLHADSQYAVDLHSSLERNFHGVRTVAPCTVEDAPTETAPFAGGRARVLRQPALLTFHALHASEGLEHLTLVRLVELVLMARRDAARGALAWEELGALLEDVGAAGFAYPALLMAERLAPGTFDGAVLEAAHRAAPPAMRRVLADLEPGDAQRFDVLTLRDRFMWCTTPADFARRLGHMLVPAPAGGSPRRLARMYVERAYRVVRGNVAVARRD